MEFGNNSDSFCDNSGEEGDIQDGAPTFNGINGTDSKLNGQAKSSPPKNDDSLIKKPLPISEVNDRIKKKAKRLSRQNSRGSSIGNGTGINGSSISVENGVTANTNHTTNYVVPQRRWKNSRRSRNAHGRGLPKKGGAGGKGTWGAWNSELLEVEYEDKNDPNYDSETNDRNIELKEVIPEITPEEFSKMTEPIILEYYEHGDSAEVAAGLDEILTGQLRPFVCSVILSMSMDHRDSQREMTSVLLSDLYGRVITSNDITKGFDILLENLPDLQLDTPEAPTILGNYLARAVADDCIPPKYVTKPDNLDSLNEYALAAIKRADTLLHLKQLWTHLDNVWGLGGPLRPVKFITKQMTLLLQEYLSSRDIQEAHRCLRSLEVPHFHHELVYEAIVMTLESLSGITEEAMCELLMSLEKACLISPAMLEQGFQRLFDDMQDIVLDVPLAYIILDRFVEKCTRAGFLTDKIIRNMPSRGRKRFVSEGDGGHIKPHTIPICD